MAAAHCRRVLRVFCCFVAEALESYIDRKLCNDDRVGGVGRLDKSLNWRP